MFEHLKHGIDTAAGLTAVSTLAGFLPPIAALFSIVWFCMQMKDRSERKRKEKETSGVA